MTAPPPPLAPVPGPVLLAPDQVIERLGVASFLSKIRREGTWALPRVFRVAAFMGEAIIDLTRVQIGPGTSDIEVMCIMGTVRVVVPHGLRVECSGTPIMGQFGLTRQSDAMPSPDAPLVRIIGTAFMGEVKVRVVDPAAPSRLAAWLQRRRAALG